MSLRRGDERDAKFCLSAGALANLPAYRCLWNRDATGQAKEEDLEHWADALLRAAPPNDACPVYTERQLARHGEGKQLWLADDFLENVAAMQTRQEFLDELKFLASMTPLRRIERFLLNAWMEGYSQEEMGHVTGMPQQKVSRLLRSALHSCFEKWELAFSQFSRHTMYRRPARRRQEWHGLICLNCGEWFAWGLGAGRYCSERCRNMRRR